MHTTCSTQFPTRPPTLPFLPMAPATAVASLSTSYHPLLPRRRLLLPTSTRCRGPTRHAAVGSDVSSSPGVAAEEAAAAPKIGRRARVTAPVRVHHVPKAPELNLRGVEGVVKQYAGAWKGKRVTASLPFKVEFQLRLEGQDKPVRFFAHLREDEFEFVGDA